MSSNHPNNNHEGPPLPSRRRLLLWGLAGGALVVAGKISDSWWSSFLKPSPSPTLYTYSGHPSGVSSVAWSPDGTRIASVGWDSTIQIWNARDGQHLLTYRSHPNAATAVWSPDSTRIASAGNDHTLQVWNASTSQKVWTHRNSSENPGNAMIGWSPDGRQIASYGKADGGAIEVRNASDGQLLLDYQGHSFVNSLAWSPDSKHITSGGWNRSVQVWSAFGGQKRWSYEASEIPNAGDDGPSYVNVVAWSPDGKQIASGGSCPAILFANNGGIQMWEASTGKKSWAYQGHNGRSDIRAVTWSPDGKQIASGATDKIVQVWSATNGKRTLTYREHTDEIRTVAWSPDGTRIVSGGADRFVRVWKAS